MPVIYAAWFGYGVLDALAEVSFQAYLAEAVPSRLRGRVFAVWGGIVALAGAIAFYAMGLLTPWLGAPLTLAVAGVVVGIGAPAALWVTGAIRSVQQGVALEAAGMPGEPS